MKRLVLIFLGLIVISACKKDNRIEDDTLSEDNHNHSHNGSFRLQFVNMLDTNLLFLDTVMYVLDNGDKLKVSKYAYYISNIKLQKQDGTWFTEAESYHLINHAVEGSKTITINDVPEGNYTAIQFMIGVDSARNVSGSQTGALDPALGMFWTWNTGYIMAKIEGTSQQSPDPQNMVAFHVGGFKGTNSALKTVNLSFAPVGLSTAYTPEAKIKSDVAEWFKSPHTINFSTTYNVTTTNTVSKQIADNYADMFSIITVH